MNTTNTLLSEHKIKFENFHQILTGNFLLVSKPYLPSPIFEKTVVLMVGNINKSTNILGVVLNKPSQEDINQTNFKENISHSALIHKGGPVANSTLFCIHNYQDRYSDNKFSRKLINQMGFISDFETFTKGTQIKDWDSKNVKYFKGIAQWNEAQITNELESDDWDMYSLDSIDLFNDNLPKLWEKFNPHVPDNLDINVFPVVRINPNHQMNKYDKVLANNKLIPDNLDIPEHLQLLTLPLTDDLNIHFVENSDQYISYLKNDFFNKYRGFEVDLLKRLSVKNMSRFMDKNIKVYGSPDEGLQVKVGDNFESSLFLVPGFMDYFHQILTGNFIFSIPTKNLLYIFKDDNNAHLQTLKELVLEEFIEHNKMPKHLLSKGIYHKVKNNKMFSLLEPAF